MKIALINGSPKIKNSSSSLILKDLKKFIEKDKTIIEEYSFRKPRLSEEEMESILNNDILVIACPLYVDGLPSHLLNYLVDLEEYFIKENKKDMTVYAIVNCGFYEAHQNEIALEIIKNWCEKSGLKWGQGMGIGAGGMLASLRDVPLGSGPKKNMLGVFKVFSNNILESKNADNIYVTPNFPKIAYKIAAEMGWRKKIKSNGLKVKDLNLRK